MRVATVFVLFLCLFVSSAFAEIENGSFDAGLDSWSVYTDGVVVVAPNAIGNPSNSVLISAQPEFGPPYGTGQISQTFYCGDPNGPTGSCMIFCEYKAVMYGSGSIFVDAYIDGVLVHHDMLSFPSGGTTGWIQTNIGYGVQCGLHTIAIKASDPQASSLSWGVWVDNVSSNCLPAPVGTESRTWGRVKSMYR